MCECTHICDMNLLFASSNGVFEHAYFPATKSSIKPVTCFEFVFFEFTFKSIANYTHIKHSQKPKKNCSTLGVLNYSISQPDVPKKLTNKRIAKYIKITYVHVIEFLSKYNHSQQLNVHIPCRFLAFCVYLWPPLTR